LLGVKNAYKNCSQAWFVTFKLECEDEVCINQPHQQIVFGLSEYYMTLNHTKHQTNFMDLQIVLLTGH